jgi:hypothetical protein
MTGEGRAVVGDLARPTDLRLQRLDSLNLVLHQQVDAALSILLADAESADRAGLVITGDGGVGKSALAGRVLRRLAVEGWAVAVHYGRWLPLTLFYAVAQAVNESPDDFPRRATTLEVLTSHDSDVAKLDVVYDLLANTPLALAFDDVGANLTGDGQGFDDPGFAALFDRLCAAAGRGRVLVTSRSDLPGQPRLRRHHLAPLDPSDALRLATQFPRLGALDPAEQDTVVTALCGHPRLLALADTWLAVGLDDGAFALEMLLGLLPDLVPPSGATADQTARFREAAVPILRAVLLTMHTQALSAPMRDTLLQAAISTVPVTARHLAAARDRRERTAEQRRSPDAADIRAAEDAGYRLVPLGLASPAADWEMYVGPWIADGLAGQQGEERSERHERAMLTHYAEMGGDGRSYTNLVAITRHLVAVHGWDDLASFALDATRFTPEDSRAYGHPVAHAALLGEVVPALPPDHPDLPRLIERRIAMLRSIGLTEAAREAAHHRR